MAAQSTNNTQYAMRNTQSLPWLVLPLLGALLIVALGTLIPLPPIVTGEEGVRTELVTSRVDAVEARYRFQQAMLDYQRFLANNEVPSALPSEMRVLATELENGADPAAIAAALKPKADVSLALGEAMYPYAQTSDEFFATLRVYEDDLMSWSRTLGPRSEQLRKATWPFIAWSSRYPEPVGTDTTYHFVPAENVRLTLEDLRATVAALDQTITPALIRRVALAADPLWQYGYDLPSYANYHEGYFSALRQYDDQSVSVAATPEPEQSTTRILLAWGGSVAVGLVMLAGLLLLFAPDRFWRLLPLPRRFYGGKSAA